MKCLVDCTKHDVTLNNYIARARSLGHNWSYHKHDPGLVAPWIVLSTT